MGLNLGNAGGGQLAMPLPGGTPAGAGAPQLQNPLAQMLAGLGPQYQVPDTRWGLPGDRLLRFTPQQGNAGMAAGGLGKGGPPPPAGGGSGIQQGPNGSSVMPGLNPLGIGDGSGTQINWANLITAMNKPTTDPAGAPAINAAMEKLKGSGLNAEGKFSGTPTTQNDVLAMRARMNEISAAKPPKGASQADKQAWYERWSAAQRDYLEAQKRTGLGPGGYTLG